MSVENTETGWFAKNLYHYQPSYVMDEIYTEFRDGTIELIDEEFEEVPFSLEIQHGRTNSTGDKAK